MMAKSNSSYVRQNTIKMQQQPHHKDLQTLKITMKVIFIMVILHFLFHCIYQTILNEDNSITKFTQFHRNSESIYPSVTICVNPFESGKLQTEILIRNGTEYLEGRHWKKMFLKRNYDTITKSMEDNLLGILMTMYNKSRKFAFDLKTNHGVNKKNTFFPKFYVSLRLLYMKC